jgi:hypothetical protein
MTEQAPRNLPWLEQLAIHIPGYGGYLDRGNRRAADRALRDAIAKRLAQVSSRIEKVMSALVDREAFGPTGSLKGLEQEGNWWLAKMRAGGSEPRPSLSEISALERVRKHADRIAARLQSAGSGTDAFYSSHHLDAAKADSLHAFDMNLFQRAEGLVQRFDAPDADHDFLANLEAELNHFEQKLDERSLLLQGIK